MERPQFRGKRWAERQAKQVQLDLGYGKKVDRN
jgi:hypothetical protein